MKSTIKLIKATYGFITGEEKDIFFHESNLDGITLHDLKEGSEVEFEVQETDKGLEAKNIKLAD